MNFIGDEIGAREFACVDLSQDDLEVLWSQLPDVVEVPPDLPAIVVVEPHLCQHPDVLQEIQDPAAVLPVISALPLPLSLLVLGQTECCQFGISFKVSQGCMLEQVV